MYNLTPLGAHGQKWRVDLPTGLPLGIGILLSNMAKIGR